MTTIRSHIRSPRSAGLFRLALTLSLAAGLTVGLLVALSVGGATPAKAKAGGAGSSAGSVIRVATGGTDVAGCGSEATPCASIQYAIDKAAPGDEIRVAGGVYSGVGPRPVPFNYQGPPASGIITQVVYLTKTLLLRGGYTVTNWTTYDPALNPTIIDAQGQGRALVVAGWISPTIAGFHLTGGDATGLGGAGSNRDAGGGAHLYGWYEDARLTISDTLIYGNTSPRYGGGVCLYWANVLFSHNTLTDNTATSGGAIYLVGGDYAEVRENTITGNDATTGGGLYVSNGGPTLSGNAIYSNTASSYGAGLYLSGHGVTTVTANLIYSNTAASGGGGVQLQSSDDVIVKGNTIHNNAAPYGGGLYLTDSNALIEGNTVRDNVASSRGGGLYLASNDLPILKANVIRENHADSSGGGLYLSGSHPDMINNAILSNHTDGYGSGIRISGNSAPRLWHNTIAYNSGGDGTGVRMSGDGTVAFTNTILVGHIAGITLTHPSAIAIVDGVLWHDNGVNAGGSGTVTVTNAHTGDPAFEADGYHLTPDSPAVNRGVSAGIGTDIDGQNRDSQPDLGADESGAVLAITKSGPFIAKPGDPIPYTLIVANNGTLTATNLLISDTLPAGAHYISGGTLVGNEVQWNVASLATGGVLTRTFTVTASATITNADYRVSADRDLSAVGQEAVVTLVTAAPYLTIAKTGTPLVNPGEPIVYTLTVANIGTTAATNLLISDTLPAGAHYVGGGTLAGNEVQWNITSLATGSTLNRTFTVTATETITNADYRVSADGGYSAVGQEAVTTIVALHTCFARVVATGQVYDNLQAAVDAAPEGGTVQVAGVCSEVEQRPAPGGGYTGPATIAQVAYLTRSLTLVGGYNSLDWTIADPAAYPTTLDAQGQGRVVVVAGEITVTLTGLNLTNGNADGLGGLITTDEGGGLLILTATVTLRDSQVYSNSAYMGGGIYVTRGHPDIVGNAIYDNAAGSQGGGVHLRFTGGTVRDNAIFDNYAREQGGGVHVVYSDVEVKGNTIYSNCAPAGGGVTLSGYHPTLRGNVIRENTSDWGGAGVYLSSVHATLVNNAILNNVILNNGPQYRGSGVLIDSALGRKPTLLHNTLSGNTGGDGSGIHVAGVNTVQLTNTILVSHTVGITVSSGSSITLTGVLWFSNGSDSGGGGAIAISDAITGDPAFALDGYHLTENSIARDSGVNSGVPDDIDGNSRPQVAGYDLGADEFVIWHYIYLPLVFRNSG